MSRQIINTAEATQPAAPISQAVRSGSFVFVSGITPFDLEFNLVKGDFEVQMRQTMSNLGAILKSMTINGSRTAYRSLSMVFGPFHRSENRRARRGGGISTTSG